MLVKEQNFSETEDVLAESSCIVITARYKVYIQDEDSSFLGYDALSPGGELNYRPLSCA